MQVWGSLGEPISCLKKLNVCLTIFQFAPEVTLGISDLILVHTLPFGNVGGTFAHKSIGYFVCCVYKIVICIYRYICTQNTPDLL